jgi:hypothetical protein
MTWALTHYDGSRADGPSDLNLIPKRQGGSGTVNLGIALRKFKDWRIARPN